MSGQAERPTLIPPVSEARDHTLGSPDARVTLCEYGDYECPYCRQAHAVVKVLIEHSGDDLCFAFRNFPLTQIHPHAEIAAEAAEAAAAQGRFWEMHDALWENQDALDEAGILEIAHLAGLDLRRFAADLNSRAFRQKVREDFLSGARSGVNGTPTFFVDGHRLDAPWDLHSLTAAIEARRLRPARARRGARRGAN